MKLVIFWLVAAATSIFVIGLTVSVIGPWKTLVIGGIAAISTAILYTRVNGGNQ